MCWVSCFPNLVSDNRNVCALDSLFSLAENGTSPLEGVQTKFVQFDLDVQLVHLAISSCCVDFANVMNRDQSVKIQTPGSPANSDRIRVGPQSEAISCV